MNIFEICIRVTGALKYIIYTSNKLLVFETTDLYFLDTNIWKNKCFNKFMKVNIKHFSEYIFWLLKYYQHKIRREIMSLNVWQYHLTQKSLLFQLHHFRLFTVSILCKFAMLPYVFILLSPQEEEGRSSFWVDKYTHLAAHSLKHWALCLCLLLY